MSDDTDDVSSAQMRLAELRSRQNLTDEEMKELVSLAKQGELISLPPFESIGLVNLERAWTNLNEVMVRAARAQEQGFCVEALSLRLQHTEFWLRMYWVARNKKGRIFAPEDKRTFGRIVEECASLGFDQVLISDLRSFNQHRIDAIHKLMLGATDYAELREVCERFQDLPGRVGASVRGAIGIALKAV